MLTSSNDSIKLGVILEFFIECCAMWFWNGLGLADTSRDTRQSTKPSVIIDNLFNCRQMNNEAF